MRYLILPLLLPTTLLGQAPLHQEIDRHIEAALSDHTTKAAPRAEEPELLRRLYLDLTGTIPTSQAARDFLADSSSDKWAKLVDQLLQSPEHARHLSEVFDVMLNERRTGKNVSDTEWREYLRQAIVTNKPWDEFAREILSADGVDDRTRPAFKFIAVRNAEPNQVTRDIGRLFLGMDLQCAQCHHHPVIDDYKQDFYYGIYAFVSRTSIVRDAKLKKAVLSEKGVGEVSFTSVFDPKKVSHTTGPRLPHLGPIKEPEVEKGKEYKVKPAKTTRGVPTWSRFSLLGPELTKEENLAFRRNIVNRLWALMMGRGLFDPVDLDHPDNPPSHPELLELMAERFKEEGYDIRFILREIALSRAYQRSSLAPEGVVPEEDEHYLVAKLKPLAPEALARSMLEATGMTGNQRRALGKKLNEATLHSFIAKSSAPLIRVLAGEPGESQAFQPTLEQALFLSNNGLLGTWVAPRSGNLADRLGKIEVNEQLAEEMYLSVLTRLPTKAEGEEVAAYLKGARQGRSMAIQDYIRALLASTEFRFNH